MPLPVLHSFAGYSIYRAFHTDGKRLSWRLAFLSIFLANLADFDFLPGLFTDVVGKYHRGITHSVGAALICAFLITFVAWSAKRISFWRNFFLCFFAYLSHVVLDFFTLEGSWMPILWPLSSARFNPPFVFFGGVADGVNSSAGRGIFFTSLVSQATVTRLIFETSVVAFILLSVKGASVLRNRFPTREAVAAVGIAAFLLIWALTALAR